MNSASDSIQEEEQALYDSLIKDTASETNLLLNKKGLILKVPLLPPSLMHHRTFVLYNSATQSSESHRTFKLISNSKVL